MTTMKIWRLAFAMLAAFSLASCGSDEPRYADPEAHEKTVQLNEQYGPLMVGTWHYENISETQRYFECLMFQADGTLTGMRKWQTRKLVTIDDKEQYTDWEDVELSGTFKGTWQLRYWSPEGNSGEKRNCLQLTATYDDAERDYMAYSAPSPSHTPTKRPSASKAITSKMQTAGSTTSAAQPNQVSNHNKQRT